MFDAEKLRGCIGGEIERFRRWGNIGVGLECVIGGEIPYFDLSFDGNDLPFGVLEDCEGAVITGLEITKNEQFRVKLSLSKNGKTRSAEFDCKRVGFTPKKYRGMSYRNMYKTWVKDLVNIAYVENAEYFLNEETHKLDEFTLNIKNYLHCDGNRELARLAVCELTGEWIKYRYRSAPSSNPRTFFDIIRHSDGRRYFPFHIDLYGISYLDVDSGEVYHYIPEGYEHDAAWDLGESFIITDIHYDPRNDLIAYGGCYWAAPSDVMVGDFSEPLNFDPHLISANKFIDPEYEEGWDINFARFEEGGIVVRNDDGTEFLIEFDRIRQRLKGE